jgi:hypothetical protein
MYARLTDYPASHKPSRSESARIAAQDYRESLVFCHVSGRFHTSVLMATLAARMATIMQISLKVIVCHHSWKCICAAHSATLDTRFRFLAKQMLDHPRADGKDYAWYKVNVYTRWWPKGRNLVIIFDPPPALRMRLPTPMLGEIDSIPTHDPYWIHLRFLEELVRIQDASVWSLRDLVRKTELVWAKLLYDKCSLAR